MILVGVPSGFENRDLSESRLKGLALTDAYNGLITCLPKLKARV